MSRTQHLLIYSSVYRFTIFNMTLTGKSAIVTGASRGIGRAIALDWRSAAQRSW